MFHNWYAILHGLELSLGHSNHWLEIFWGIFHTCLITLLVHCETEWFTTCDADYTYIVYFQADNAKYTSETILQELLSCMAKAVRRPLLEAIRNSPYSVMIDETTDVSITKQFITYIRFLDEGNKVSNLAQHP